MKIMGARNNMGAKNDDTKKLFDRGKKMTKFFCGRWFDIHSYVNYAKTFFTAVFHRCPLNCNEWHIIMMKMSSLWMGKLAHSVHIVPLFWITVLLLFYTKFQFQMTISYGISLFLLLPYFPWFIWIPVEFKLKIFRLTVIFMIFQLFEWIPNTRFYHVMFTLLYSSLLNVENWFPLRSK